MKDLEVLEAALNLATQKGAFNLQDTAAILNALQGLKDQLKETKVK